MSADYIISRSNGRIYLGLLKYFRASNGSAVAWGDTDAPHLALTFPHEEAHTWASRLREAPQIEDPEAYGFLLAPLHLRDWEVQPLEGAIQHEGHRLFRAVEVEPTQPLQFSGDDVCASCLRPWIEPPGEGCGWPNAHLTIKSGL